MDKLLSEQELEAEVRRIVRWGDHEKGYGIANYGELAALIQSQKQAHANMVIGEDGSYIAADDITDTETSFKIQDRMRSCQRKRNRP